MVLVFTIQSRPPGPAFIDAALRPGVVYIVSQQLDELFQLFWKLNVGSVNGLGIV